MSRATRNSSAGSRSLRRWRTGAVDALPGRGASVAIEGIAAGQADRTARSAQGPRRSGFPSPRLLPAPSSSSGGARRGPRQTALARPAAAVAAATPASPPPVANDTAVAADRGSGGTRDRDQPEPNPDGDKRPECRARTRRDAQQLRSPRRDAVPGGACRSVDPACPQTDRAMNHQIAAQPEGIRSPIRSDQMFGP